MSAQNPAQSAAVSQNNAPSVSGDAAAFADTTTQAAASRPAATKKHRTNRTARRRPGWVDRTARKINGLPLATRLIIIVLVLLGVGFTVTGIAVNSLVWDYLVAQDDEQLTRQAQLVISNISHLDAGSNSAPTDYYLQIRDKNGRILATPLIPRQRGGMVSVPVLPASGTKVSRDKLQQPFTTKGRLVSAGTGKAGRDPGQWRVVALEWVNQTTGDTGTLYLGMSLANATDTVRTSVKYFIIICLLTFVIAASLGWILITRSLKPLRDIERTASKIAAGDLSQRVPELPEHTEVGSLSASLNMMLNRIEQSFHDEEETNAKMRRFVSDASHELRTPLAAISGYGQLYQMQKSTAEDPVALADSIFAKIGSSTERMTRLVNDLLSLARLDEGRGQHVVEGVPLAELLGGSCEDLHALDVHRPISLGRLDLAPETAKKPGSKIGDIAFDLGQFEQVALACDPDQVRRVFTNIVGNIHRYTPSDSPVEVSLTLARADMSVATAGALAPEEQSWKKFVRAMRKTAVTGQGRPFALIRFTDHGPGVKPEALTRIFDRFYTADPSRAREKGGTGLGMALALSVVKSQSGFIVASATPGGGLTQTIVLPVQETVGEVLSSYREVMGGTTGAAQAQKGSASQTA